MRRYSEEFKEAAVQKMMPPNPVSISQLVQETGVSDVTLYKWRKQYRERGFAVPADDTNPDNWKPEDKLAVVIETAAMNEAELGAYCRSKGLYPEQVQRWKRSALMGYQRNDQVDQALSKNRKGDKREIKSLKSELLRKEKALAETAALLVLSKKSPCHLGGARGRLISSEDRQMAISLIDAAVTQGARQVPACSILGISVRTLQRWNNSDLEDKRKAVNKAPINRLSEEEREQVLETCNREAYRSLSPKQIVPALADNGIYLASESTFYRVLREKDLMHSRGRMAKPSQHNKPKELVADGPGQVWSWDITYLAAGIRGTFFYLYLFMDIYSRKITGWEVYEYESAELAADLLRKARLSENIPVGQELTVHSDNGGPMKGASMLAIMQKLGVVPSFSRPAVSNDNPYSESLFKTMKYTPAYPDRPFESVTVAREWINTFVRWYNGTHRHSGLKYVTPEQRHRGQDTALLEARSQLYLKARERHPERWSGDIRNWKPVSTVTLNPSSAQTNGERVKQAA
ncbi:MAG: IS3 family transposase [Candidatus Thiodiazotropha sp. (ex Lucinoma borealis)]|nr:IS3 family transposase [Candidatus Thiodiazotropha sp. (ex Lucinoma borealis)]